MQSYRFSYFLGPCRPSIGTMADNKDNAYFYVSDNCDLQLLKISEL